jgi:FkbM family methyltransferase
MLAVDRFLTHAVKATVFRIGRMRRITSGPLRGCRLRVDSIAGRTSSHSDSSLGCEAAHLAFFASQIERGDTAIDVGAGWGADSLLMARFVGRAGRVIAVEPRLMARKSLRWHVHRNHCRQIYVVPGAASNFDGTRSIDTSAAAAHADTSTGSGSIAVYQLDTLWRGAGRPRVSFVKIDADGDEAAVLDGARAILDRDRPAFLIRASRSDEACARIVQDLMRRGYRVWRAHQADELRAVPIERPSNVD